MQVNKIPGLARTEASERAQAPSSVAAPSGVAADQAGATAPRTDGVQISDEGLALASSAAPDQTAPSDLETARANELRSKIFTGAYNALGMAEQVARAIVRSGDL